MHLGKPRTRRTGVVIAFPHAADMSSRFALSLLALTIYDRDGAWYLDERGKRRDVAASKRFLGFLPISSGANIVTARNTVVRQFLENEWEFDAQWLWFVDTDMTFHADTLDRLLATAHPKERPIVGALCYALLKGDEQEIVPTIYGNGAGTKLVRANDYPPNTVLPVAATGAACLLIHRSVLESIRDRRWTDSEAEQLGVPAGELTFPPPWPWFAETVTGTNYGDSISEDITFCRRAQLCGFPIVVDTSIKTGHVKPVVIDEEAYAKAFPRPEEPAPTFVVIPVKGKHEFTRSILEQLREQGGYERLFLFDNASETDPLPEDCYGDDMTLVDAEGWNFHRMWNDGIKRSIAENPRCNIAILNNDLELGPDFLRELADGLRAHPQFLSVCGNYDKRTFGEKVQAVQGIAAGREDGTGGWAGFGFMLRGEVFAGGFPLFDENYHLWYGDNDMLIMIEASGGCYGVVRDAHMLHIGGGSNTSGDGSNRLTPELEALVDEDRAYFEKKWQIQMASA